MAEKMQGVVDWFEAKKGYGFIKCEVKVFLHYKQIVDGTEWTLKAGDKVEFELEPEDVRLISKKVVRIG